MATVARLLCNTFSGCLSNDARDFLDPYRASTTAKHRSCVLRHQRSCFAAFRDCGLFRFFL